MDRYDLVDGPRLGANTATERYQPHHGIGRIKEAPEPHYDNSIGPHSIITRSDLGYGASFAWTEPVGSQWHKVIGPEPLVDRATGA